MGIRYIHFKVSESEGLDLVQWMEKIICLQRLDDPFEIMEYLKKQILSQLPTTDMNPDAGMPRMDMRWSKKGCEKNKKKAKKKSQQASDQSQTEKDGENSKAKVS